MAEQVPGKAADAGAPAWVMTFADLMSLLMCFFVLLLSFSEMDLEKYKQVAGSMKFAFGVQREIKANEAPKGTSIIAQEFSSGRPTPTVVNEVRQATVDDSKQTLEFTDAMNDEKSQKTDFEPTQGEDDDSDSVNKQTQVDANKLLEALREEMEQGMVQVETVGSSILIRINEKASFPSGTATLRGDFLPVLGKLRNALADVPGQVVVAGHTDDIPINTAVFRSNWDLSAARAVTVVHELLGNGQLAIDRFVVEGHGEAHPLLPNDSPENRATNRRVELTIIQGERAVGISEGLQFNEILGRSDTAGPESDRAVEADVHDDA